MTGSLKEFTSSWNVKLDEESSYLTTFNTPFGRFPFLRMPFGLCMGQDNLIKHTASVMEPSASWMTLLSMERMTKNMTYTYMKIWNVPEKPAISSMRRSVSSRQRTAILQTVHFIHQMA